MEGFVSEQTPKHYDVVETGFVPGIKKSGNEF